MFAVPSLKPNRLRGVAAPSRSTRCGRSRAATSARRRCRSRSGRGCGSRARRPAGRRRTPGRRGRRRAARVEVVGGEVRQRAQRLGLPVGEAEPVLAVGVANSDGPKPKVRVSPRRQPERLAGVVRRWVVGPSTGPLARRPALGHPRPRRGPGLQQRDQLGARRRWSRRTPRSAAGPGPAWRCRPGARRGRGGRRRPARPPASGSPCGGRAAPTATHRAADRPRRRRRRPGRAGRRGVADIGQDSTAAVSLDSGSDERVDRVAELLDLVLAQLVVVRRSRRPLGTCRAASAAPRTAVQLVSASSGSFCSTIGFSPRSRPGRRRRWPGSPTGRCAPVLLLAGDLAGGDLVEQLPGAVGDLVDGVPQLLRPGCRGRRCPRSGRRRTSPLCGVSGV